MKLFNIFQKTPPQKSIPSFTETEKISECIKLCKTLKTNLVVANYYWGCDAETAKYRGRIFCIDGKDKRFPLLTDEVIKCNLYFDPFIWGVSPFYVYDKKTDPIKYSNRPFIDDRTLKEKDQYDSYV